MFCLTQMCRVEFSERSPSDLLCVPGLLTRIPAQTSGLQAALGPRRPWNQGLDHYFGFYETAVFFCTNVKFFLKMLLVQEAG